MAEIGDPENLVPEGFWARFVKTEGFWDENNRILQLFKENVSFRTNFSLILKKIGPIESNLILVYQDCESEKLNLFRDRR